MTKTLQRLFAFTFSLALTIACAAAQAPADTSMRNLSLEQQTKIRDVITRDAGAGASIRGAHFSLAIGNAVPAEVQLRPVPASVGEVAPQFRDASYVVVEEEIAIVDSRDRKILAVVQRGLSQTGSVPAPTR